MVGDAYPTWLVLLCKPGLRGYNLRITSAEWHHLPFLRGAAVPYSVSLPARGRNPEF